MSEAIYQVEQIKPKTHNIIKFGRHDYRVIDEQDGKMLILSDKVIDFRRMLPTRARTTWAESELRGYLNSEFYNSFNDEEKTRIIQTRLENKDNKWYKKPGGEDTDDYIFLLSIEDEIKYFGDSGDYDRRKGWYWSGEGDIMEYKSGKGQFLYDQYNAARIAEDMNGKPTFRYTRSIGKYDKAFSVVNHIGSIIVTGCYVENNNGIRPSMWIKI